MIVTTHEYEIIELLQDTLSDAIKEEDILRYIAHSYHYTRKLIMSLKCKRIVRTEQIKTDTSQHVKWILLEDEYK